jgi:hypothetical protein
MGARLVLVDHQIPDVAQGNGPAPVWLGLSLLYEIFMHISSVDMYCTQSVIRPPSITDPIN